jgi:hypothetical protein
MNQEKEMQKILAEIYKHVKGKKWKCIIDHCDSH